MSESFLNNRVTLHAGDCLDVMPTLEENSIDAVCCDPPYHLTSIVKRFSNSNVSDATKTSERVRNRADGYARLVGTGFMNAKWDGGDIAYRDETWASIMRVLKPGAYCAAFGSTRGGHNMAAAMERAGFIMHPFIAWVFATGFPKATRVQSDEWEGWRYGTQSLKPAIEPIYVGQKPFSEKTGTANVLRWGTGALNIDACRIHSEDVAMHRLRHGGGIAGNGTSYELPDSRGEQPPGRWPANLCHDGSDEVVAEFPETKSLGHLPRSGGAKAIWQHGKEIREDIGANNGFGGSGSAARFFFSAKADAHDRIGSKHPTIKPIDLMQWLCRLITPPGGTVLDCFAGTGTTAEAAYHEGFSAVLIEREPEYQADIRRRMALILSGPDERKRESIKARGRMEDAGPLFGTEL